jgi:hypothetical protein
MKYQKLYDLVKYKRGIIKEMDTPYISDKKPSKISTDCAITHLISFYIMDIMTSCETQIQLENAKNWALNITKNGTPFMKKNADKTWWINIIDKHYKENMCRFKNKKQ